jgi:hypothetical protein
MSGWRTRLAKVRRVLGEVLYGMALHDFVRANLKARGSLEHLFILITFGDLVGMPILPPYYALRLLPFIVPEINSWRRRLARERDYLDSIF